MMQFRQHVANLMTLQNTVGSFWSCLTLHHPISGVLVPTCYLLQKWRPGIAIEDGVFRLHMHILCCSLASAELQRAHYKTDWHRYNLKRKVAELPPVTAEDFTQKVLAQRAADAKAREDAPTTAICRRRLLLTSLSKAICVPRSTKKGNQVFVMTV